MVHFHDDCISYFIFDILTAHFFIPGAAVMLTCPHCHHLIAPQSPCTHTSQPLLCSLTTPVCSLPPTPVPPPVSPAPQLGSSLGAPPWGRDLQEDLISPVAQGHTSLPTPHISGSMFHFPVVQFQPHTNCPSHQGHSCQLQCVTHGVHLGQTHADNVCGGGLLRPQQQFNVARTAAMCQMPVHNHSMNWDTSLDWRKSVRWTGDDDARVLSATKKALLECGWYWQKLTWQDAIQLLQSCSIGTFIIRDSADRNYRFSLSVQTEKGPTSVRIDYNRGKFRLDCENSMKSTLPEFSNVINLVEHYVKVSKKGGRHVWVDSHGKVYSPIIIRRPLTKTTPSLKHLCRMTINMSLARSYTAERLPPNLTKYLDEYSFWC